MELRNGELIGRVEIPQDGWFHDYMMGVLFKGVDHRILDLPVGHGVPHYGNQRQDKSWTSSNFRPKV